VLYAQPRKKTPPAKEVSEPEGRHGLDVNAVVSYNLKATRERQGWTQQEVADRLARLTGHTLPQASISAMERGFDGERRRRFDAHELYLLSVLFDVPLVYFFVPPADSERAQLADTRGPVSELYAAVLGHERQLAPVDERLAEIGFKNPDEADQALVAILGAKTATGGQGQPAVVVPTGVTMYLTKDANAATSPAPGGPSVWRRRGLGWPRRRRPSTWGGGSTTEGGPGGFHGVEGVGLAAATALLAIRPVEFDDLDARASQVTSEAGPKGPGAFDANLGHGTEALESNPGKTESCATRDEEIVRNHINPILEARPVASINRRDIQSLVAGWSRAQGPRTVSRQFDVLRAIFNYAVDSDVLGNSLAAASGSRSHPSFARGCSHPRS
jgi:transcriptional regulator with XRE-family HTH domain